MFFGLEDIFSKRYVLGYFGRNKFLILVSLSVLLLSFLLGILISDQIRNVMLELLRNMVSNYPLDNTVVDNMFLLFFNNVRVDFMVLLGGLIFSLFSVLITITNGIVLGFVFTMVPFSVFVVGIFPHGIFELSASVIALTGAFILTMLEIRLIFALFKGRFRECLGNSHVLIKDIVFSVILFVVLLVIAAIIESAVTPVLLGFII